MHPGFNHNIKYKDKIYHIQSEDSGLENPHIITHLFIGGNIIETVKTDYSKLLVARENLDERIADLMKKQHKDMMRKLITGQFDAKLGIKKADTPLFATSPKAEAELIGDEDDGQLFLGVISEKSLDEVILSFLSDEEAKGK